MATDSSPAEHLRPYWFQKGKSGNPGGRKKDHAAAIAEQAFTRQPEAVIRGFMARLKKGDARAFKELADRGYGKLPQPVAVTGGDGGPLVIEIRDIGGKQ